MMTTRLPRSRRPDHVPGIDRRGPGAPRLCPTEKCASQHIFPQNSRKIRDPQLRKDPQPEDAKLETRPVLNPQSPRSKIILLLFLKLWQVSMPHYEFFCQECKKLFDKILSLVDYEEGEVLCPHCGSKRVEQRWSAFSAITSKKSG